jgi:ferredoxin
MTGDDPATDGGTANASLPPTEGLPTPATGRTPENVLRTVLSALATPDDPHEDAGLVVAFNFASPNFRAENGGDLASFADTLRDPMHGSLVGHREAARGRLDREGTEATEKVVVTAADGSETTYQFDLERQSGGKYDGCWLVTGIDLVYVGATPDHQHMPSVEFSGVEMKCKEGEVLRDVLLRASGVSPYNGGAEYANCNGNGLCGTCAVEVVEGEVTEKTGQERRRLKLPPLSGAGGGVRLSCQCRVLSDLTVHKHDGLWGQHVEEVTRTEEVGDPVAVSREEYLGMDGQAAADGDTDEMEFSDDAAEVLDDTEELLD